eukprot:1742502-Rhodomonas_salina.1
MHCHSRGRVCTVGPSSTASAYRRRTWRKLGHIKLLARLCFLRTPDTTYQRRALSVVLCGSGRWCVCCPDKCACERGKMKRETPAERERERERGSDSARKTARGKDRGSKTATARETERQRDGDRLRAHTREERERKSESERERERERKQGEGGERAYQHVTLFLLAFRLFPAQHRLDPRVVQVSPLLLKLLLRLQLDPHPAQIQLLQEESEIKERVEEREEGGGKERGGGERETARGREGEGKGTGVVGGSSKEEERKVEKKAEKERGGEGEGMMKAREKEKERGAERRGEEKETWAVFSLLTTSFICASNFSIRSSV